MSYVSTLNLSFLNSSWTFVTQFVSTDLEIDNDLFWFTRGLSSPPSTSTWLRQSWDWVQSIPLGLTIKILLCYICLKLGLTQKSPRVTALNPNKVTKYKGPKLQIYIIRTPLTSVIDPTSVFRAAFPSRKYLNWMPVRRPNSMWKYNYVSNYKVWLNKRAEKFVQLAETAEGSMLRIDASDAPIMKYQVFPSEFSRKWQRLRSACRRKHTHPLCKLDLTAFHRLFIPACQRTISIFLVSHFYSMVNRWLLLLRGDRWEIF